MHGLRAVATFETNIGIDSASRVVGPLRSAYRDGPVILMSSAVLSLPSGPLELRVKWSR
jgi:hypothetical protein